MSNRSKTCPQCLKPTTTASSGSLTQWIVVCACDLTADPEKTPLEIRLCKRCGKRVEQGRAGSFTQFIFRADLCSCDKPEFFSAYPQAQPLSVDPIHKDESPDDEGLVLSDAKFPVDRYKPIRLLGEGRGGSVYLCRDRLLDKLVAVKTLNHLNDGELVSFHEEARVLSRLEHRSIIKILDFGASESGVPFMVLELGRGITLSEQLKKKGTLGVKEALDLFGELARALAYSHGKGVFHRDLKPENILLTDPGTDDSPVRLLDFGVAMVDFEDWQSVEIDGRTVVGTPAYMSPDVVNGLEFDARSEVYCLGCVLYEALIGKPPFSASTSLETILEHVDKPFPQPEEFDRLPQALVQLLAGCLVKDPEERFQSMEELATSLANISLSADDRDKTSVPLTGRMSYRSPLFAVGMLLFLTTFTCIAFSFFSFNQSEPFRSARQSPKLAYSESRARKSPMLVEQLSSRAKLKNRIRVSGTIDRQDLKRLAANKNIQSLTFDSTADVDWSGLVFFKDSNLEILSLKRTSFSDKDMQYIL
ncbi:MAG: serine/threonine protein kinase, partial [Candidatus Obscuribacterales bacterium]|nr:serine/threonine protein kinase [Candidatus Obscuribacterales bacterium]